MGGGRAFSPDGHIHAKLPFHPLPPLSAIDRFLVGQGQSNVNGDCADGLSASWLLPDHVDYPDISLSLNHETTNEKKKNASNHPVAQFETQRGRSSSASLVKRKWTEDEDRALTKLVSNYGVKKWASIAQKLDGRTPKQCRERWQNHLRPDIKKDSWTEEEEKIFVEAHEKLGNRWSEIARKIPGRTENAVKNHWNAAKRKKVGKTCKKDGGKCPKQSSLLQEYITKNNLCDNFSYGHPQQTLTLGRISNAKHDFPTSQEMGAHEKIEPHCRPISAAPEAVPKPYHPLPLMEDSGYSSSDIPETFDEELLFMLHFFNNRQLQQSPLLLQDPGFMAQLTNPNNGNYLHDFHLSSCLLGGTTSHSNFSSSVSSSSPSSANVDYYCTDCFFGDNGDLGLDGGQVNKDMDMIEMVTSSRSS